MGPAGLTAVFGMGTGGAPQVSSPESAGRAVRPARLGSLVFDPGVGVTLGRAHVVAEGRSVSGRATDLSGRSRALPCGLRGGRACRCVRRGGDAGSIRRSASSPCGAGPDRGGQAFRLLGPVGCGGRPPCTPGLSTWWSSRSLHSSSANGNLVLKRASRLDAFSAYPFPTWLPGDAPSGTAGTPEVGPPQSSRTRGDPSQVSYAHGR